MLTTRSTQEQIENAPGAHKRQDLSILIFNGDFPVYPGGLSTEFLNTSNLAALARRVGLVSMIHTADVWRRTSDLKDAGVELFLWKSPGIDSCEGPLVESGRPEWLNRLHARFVDRYTGWKAWPSVPREAVIADLNFRNMSRSLSEALSKGPWGVFVVVQSQAARAIDYIPEQAVKVLIMHDIRSVVYTRAAEVANSRTERIRRRAEARRYFRFEKKYIQRYDLVVAVSEADAAWIRENYGPKRTLALPLPVETDYFAPESDVPEHFGRIVFTGLMNHPPNTDAAVFFATEVFPLIREQVPGAEFFLVGRNPPPQVVALGSLAGVTVTGAVPDTRPYLSSAAVFVVPLRFGSGVRSKILEAWAMEKCVVATTIGAEGLSYKDGIHLAIADDARSMADVTSRALSDFTFRASLRKSGREIAIKSHNPRDLAGKYYEELQNIFAERAVAPMRVALDMRWMIPGVAGGIEQLARALLREIMKTDHCNRYTVILPGCCRYDFDLRNHRNFRITCPDSAEADAREVLWRVKRRMHALLRLDYWHSPEVRSLRGLRSLDADVVYSFPGYIHPDVYPLRHVLQVPDIQHEYFPEFFSPEALSERRRIYNDSISRAEHICAISEFTRQTLIERLAVSPEKITAVPLAADPIFRHENSMADHHVLHRYGLKPGSYLFFPGHTWHHKNHRAAIECLRILADRRSIRPLLVCTGGAREAQSGIEEQIGKLGLSSQVRFLGYCDRGELPALYRRAACLVFPSLFEGFGMPIVEAMACGCPVICSNTTSLPEIAGDAALLVDPTNPETLAHAVHSVWTEPVLRNELIGAGFGQAAQFSWHRTALKTLSVLYQVQQRWRKPEQECL